MTGLLWLALTLASVACGDGGSALRSPTSPLPPGDSVGSPVDSGPSVPPPTDSGTPPPPPSPPPPAPPPSGPPVHDGIPFGPAVFTKHDSERSVIPPAELPPGFSALVATAYRPTVMEKLEEARRTNGRVLLNLSGVGVKDTLTGGFSLETWKQNVAKFRDLDFSSYIADGTLMGHFLMDEPSDPSNWNGHVVSKEEIEAMAEYSKELWPDLPAIIRGWPDYLKGYDYKYLDAAWAQYHERFGPIDTFIEENVRQSKALGLDLVLGLNVLAGGGREEGIPGYHNDKFAMTASQITRWGNALLDQPYGCAFFMFKYPSPYFDRPEIREALLELGKKAASRPNVPCRRS